MPLPSQYILLCFYRFYWCIFFRKCSICILSREYHLSLLTQMIRKYLVMFAVSLIVPLDIHSMLWSQKMWEIKEIICFVDWITGNAWANCRRHDAWSWFETCLFTMFCCEWDLMSHSPNASLCWGTYGGIRKLLKN